MADDHVHLYVDGILRRSVYDAYTSVTFEPAVSGCVIAVELINAGTGSEYGFLASSTSGLLDTDTTWKCSWIQTSGWSLCEFDDSRWSNAAIVAANGDQPWGRIAGIDAAASWIWASGGTNVYCRKRLCQP